MKNKINQLFDRIFYTPATLSPGLFSSMIDIDEKPHRLHLRIENDGSGMLVVDASTVLHLNQTATEIAYFVVSDLETDEIKTQLVKRYQVTPEVAGRTLKTSGIGWKP